MIDRDTLRTARRTVERNGYTVLPPRDKDEKDLSRFRTRREVEREDREARPAPRARYREDEEDVEPARTRPTPRFRDTVENDEPPRRFKPLRQREYDDEDEEPRRSVRSTRQVEDDYDDEPRRPARTTRYRDEEDYDDEPRRPARPARREMNDDEKLGAAIRTAEENGFTIRKMSRLDQAKQVARDNGYDFRKVDDDEEDTPRRPIRRPVAATEDDGGNDKPAVRPVPARAQRPLIRPKANPNVNDGIRTRTAPDTELKGGVEETPAPAPTQDTAPTQTETPAEPPKKPTYADDFMDRAARFFGEDE